MSNTHSYVYIFSNREYNPVLQVILITTNMVHLLVELNIDLNIRFQVNIYDLHCCNGNAFKYIYLNRDVLWWQDL